MKVYNITPQDWVRSALLLLSFYLLFQIAALAGQAGARLYIEHEATDRLKSRMSLDLQFLDVGNDTLNTPPNQDTLKEYLDRLNTTLEERELGIWLVSIQSVIANPEIEQLEHARLTKMTLQNSEQSVHIQLAIKPIYHYLSFSPLALFGALLLTPAFIARKQVKPKTPVATMMPPPAPIVKPKPKLQINLTEKSIGNNVNNVTVQLQNKPLCFYTALLRFCVDNPHAVLLHHKDIPTELSQQAIKVFGRLMELGHTKRKRPDFNANLDKTLSEIRAALDEVFAGYSDEKALYYPPRAQGEGSRSKQHSYAITNITADDIEIIGD